MPNLHDGGVGGLGSAEGSEPSPARPSSDRGGERGQLEGGGEPRVLPHLERGGGEQGHQRLVAPLE